MELALSEMQAIASEILLACGPHYAAAAYDVAANPLWWDFLPKERGVNTFSDAHAYFVDNVASNLWKKFQDFPGDATLRKAKALEKWHEAERQCYKTNRRFDDYIRGDGRFCDLEPRVVEFLYNLQKECRHVLGRVPSALKPRFGPGSTYASRGNVQCTVPCKISTVPTMTKNVSAHWVRDWRETLWGRNTSSLPPFSGAVDISDSDNIATWNAEAFAPWGTFAAPIFVPGNRYDTVPKNRDQDRSIAIEPSLNVSYQLAVGAYLKTRLRSFGQLLTEHVDWLERRCGVESQELHRMLAQFASNTGSLTTIDLSAASDTVAYSFVEWCLPHAWFVLLAGLRSPTTVIEGTTYHLEKFSSMGNGFTFELETLLFFCVVRVTLRMSGRSVSSVNVFGDDIIAPNDAYPDVVAALRFCGFTPNTSKSFHTGPFRESCGGDYFGGKSVRAPYITGAPRNVGDWMVIHNQLARLRDVLPEPFHVWQAQKVCLRNIPQDFRNYGPSVYGDTVLHGKTSRRWRVSRRRYNSHDRLMKTSSRIWHIRVTVSHPQDLPWDRWDGFTAASSRLYGCEGSRVSLRGDPESFSVAWVPLTTGLLQQAGLVNN